MVYLRYFTDNFAKNIFLVILSAIICSLGLFCVNHIYSTLNCLEVYRAYGLDEGVLYQSGNLFNSQDQNKEVIEKIQHLEGVREIRPLESITQVMALNGDDGIYLMNVTPEVRFFPWKIVKGRMISRDSSNEICLTSNFVEKYDIGDVLDVILVGEEESKGKLTVVGFFDIDSYMPNDMGSFRYEVNSWDNNGVAYAFTCNLTDVFGEKIIFGSDQYIFVKPKTGYDINKLKKEIISVSDGGVVWDYSDYKDVVYNRNKDTNDLINLIFLASFVFLVAVLSAFTLIQISVNKNQLLVYYVNGCTWSKAVGIACFSNLPLLLIGVILGVIAYIKIPLFSLMTNGDYLFNFQAMMIVIAAMIIVYLMLCGSFYLFTVKQSVTEQLRGE